MPVTVAGDYDYAQNTTVGIRAGHGDGEPIGLVRGQHKSETEKLTGIRQGLPRFYTAVHGSKI